MVAESCFEPVCLFVEGNNFELAAVGIVGEVGLVHQIVSSEPLLLQGEQGIRLQCLQNAAAGGLRVLIQDQRAASLFSLGIGFELGSFVALFEQRFPLAAMVCLPRLEHPRLW